jgi:murein DD-endopeptidase MepM/ murein hydrolase activator NlpD
MNISYPVEKGTLLNQAFGGNSNPLYAKQGMDGHTGEDWGFKFGQTIYSVSDCYVYSTINLGPSPEKYRAVYTLVVDGEFAYEISYGHVIDCLVPVDSYIKKGTPIARMGNFGDVYAGGHYVTKAEKINGSTEGTHLHFQVRKCLKRTKREGSNYLKDSKGYLQVDGYYFQIEDYQNGYKGCVDPQPFYDKTWPVDPHIPPTTQKYIFNNDFGTSTQYSKDAEELQELLISKGFMEPVPYSQKGLYGPKTAKAVLSFQLGMDLPLSFYEQHVLAGKKVGPKTREALNNLG